MAFFVIYYQLRFYYSASLALTGALLGSQNLHHTFPSGVNDTSVLNFDVFSHHSYTKVQYSTPSEKFRVQFEI